MNILDEKVVTDTEAKEILEKREKESEMKFEQKNTLEILRKFVTVEKEKLDKLVEELKTVEHLRDKHIVEIANFLPEDKDDLRVVLHKEYTNFTPEEIEKILQIVKNNI
jgi:DNA-directed RNA polymerase subunit F